MALKKNKMCLTCKAKYTPDYNFCIKDGTALSEVSEQNILSILDALSTKELIKSAKKLITSDCLKTEFKLLISQASPRKLRLKLMELCHLLIPQLLEKFIWEETDQWRIDYLMLNTLDLRLCLTKPYREKILNNASLYFCLLRNLFQRKVNLTKNDFEKISAIGGSASGGKKPEYISSLYYYYQLKNSFGLTEEDISFLQQFPDRDLQKIAAGGQKISWPVRSSPKIVTLPKNFAKSLNASL